MNNEKININDNQNRESWNKQAERFYKEDCRSLKYLDYCGEIFPSDENLKIIGDVNGLNVLEIGAGTCNCGIVLAKQGAKVTCLDISVEQLNLGAKIAEKENILIKTIESDMENLCMIDSDSVDLVISMSAIMYVKDIDKVFDEVHRVLKKNGRFVFSTDHPFIMSLGATELWSEENANPNYMYRGPVEWKWNEDDTFFFTTYRRPLMDYVNGLIHADFRLNRFEELLPKQIDLNWDENEKHIRMRYPSVFVIESIKN